MNTRLSIRLFASAVLSLIALILLTFSQTNAQSGTEAATSDTLSRIIIWSIPIPSGNSLGLISTVSMLDPATGAETDLVQPANTASGLALSPDGKFIAYAGLGKFGSDLFIMNVNGTNQRQITKDQSIGLHNYPSWSPDGQKLAYTSAGAMLRVVNIDGSDDQLLVNTPTGEPLLDTAWSPDGNHILFQSGLARGHLYDLNLKTGKASQFTDITTGQSVSPHWSPDGTKVLFISERDDGNRTIYVASADGTDAKALPSNSYRLQGSLAWSPDGTKIAATYREGIVIMNADGTSPNVVWPWPPTRPSGSILWGLIPTQSLENLAPFQTLVPTLRPTRVVIPTTTLVPTQTLDPNGFDVVNAPIYKADNGSFEIKLPHGWQPITNSPANYSFFYGPSNNPVAVLHIYFGTLTSFNANLSKRAATVSTIDDLVNAYRASFQQLGTKNTVYGDIVRTKIGILDGEGFQVHQPSTATLPMSIQMCISQPYPLVKSLW